METSKTRPMASEKTENFKQKLLRKMYPIIRKLGKKGKYGTILTNDAGIAPKTSFFDLSIKLNNGKSLEFSSLKGKKTLLVNTASNCGYTGQYSELQTLNEQMGNKLQIIGFPSNDFAEQEKSNDDEIASFCQVNYGVSFPIANKGVVLKNENQQPVFQWLTDKSSNGWNDHVSDWNFSKFLVDENGILTHYFGPSISPLDGEVLKAI